MKPEAAKVWEEEGSLARGRRIRTTEGAGGQDVAERIGAGVPEAFRIRRCADSEGVEDDENGTRQFGLPLPEIDCRLVFMSSRCRTL